MVSSLHFNGTIELAIQTGIKRKNEKGFLMVFKSFVIKCHCMPVANVTIQRTYLNCQASEAPDWFPSRLPFPSLIQASRLISSRVNPHNSNPNHISSSSFWRLLQFLYYDVVLLQFKAGIWDMTEVVDFVGCHRNSDDEGHALREIKRHLTMFLIGQNHFG